MIFISSMHIAHHASCRCHQVFCYRRSTHCGLYFGWASIARLFQECILEFSCCSLAQVQAGGGIWSGLDKAMEASPKGCPSSPLPLLPPFTMVFVVASCVRGFGYVEFSRGIDPLLVCLQVLWAMSLALCVLCLITSKVVLRSMKQCLDGSSTVPLKSSWCAFFSHCATAQSHLHLAHFRFPQRGHQRL